MNTNQTVGSALLVIGAVIGIFAYAHRPIENLMDAFNRNGSLVLKPGAYYAALGLAALFVIGGIVRLAKKVAVEARKE